MVRGWQTGSCGPSLPDRVRSAYETLNTNDACGKYSQTCNFLCWIGNPLNSSNDNQMRPADHYSRAQFVSDAAWMGLDLDQAFSRKNLRRQRDQLMYIHHPDRGGSEEMAACINLAYSRMLAWLDRHLESRSYLRLRREEVLAKEAARSADEFQHSAEQKIQAIRAYVVVLGAATTLLGLGLSAAARRRR